MDMKRWRDRLVAVVKQSLSKAADPQASTNMAWIETALRDVLRQIGAAALGQFLSASPSIPPRLSGRAPVGASCGINACGPRRY